MKEPPFTHQRASTAFMSAKPRVLDLSDPGTGKTRSALDAVATNGGRALVLAPLSILDVAWRQDCERFTPQLKIGVAHGRTRLQVLRDSELDIVVTNHAAVRWLLDEGEVLDRFRWLIVDEFTAYKNAKSQRSAMLRAICTPPDRFPRRILMSGTPMAQSPLDIWHPALLADDGHRLGRNFRRFQDQFCVGHMSYDGTPHMEFKVKPTAVSDILTLLSDIVVRHKLEDCLDLPSRSEKLVPVPLAPRQRDAYKRLARDSYLALADGTATAPNAGVMSGKLRQLASGMLYGDKGVMLLDTSRYKLAHMLIAEHPGQSVVTFLWRFQRDQMMKLLQGSFDEVALLDSSISPTARSEFVRMFQDGKIKVLLMHPACAAHGLTLTAANLLIWLSPTFSLEMHVQTNARLYRHGQARNVSIVTLASPNTVEDRVAKALAGKGEGHEECLKLASSMSGANLRRLLQQDMNGGMND